MLRLHRLRHLRRASPAITKTNTVVVAEAAVVAAAASAPVAAADTVSKTAVTSTISRAADITSREAEEEEAVLAWDPAEEAVADPADSEPVLRAQAADVWAVSADLRRSVH